MDIIVARDASSYSVRCDNTPVVRPPTISKSLNRTTHGQWFIQWFFLVSDQGYYTFHYKYEKYNREGGRTNKQANMDLGQLQVQKGSLWHCAFSVHLQTIAGVYFAWNVYKAANNAWHLLALVNLASVGQQVLSITFQTSIDSLLCPTSIFSLPPSADRLILWTAASSRLGFSSLCCQLPSQSSLGLSFPPTLSVIREVLSSNLCVGFAPKQTKRSSEWRQHKRKKIATHCVTKSMYSIQNDWWDN